MLDKLKFWKKESPFDANIPDLNAPSLPADPQYPTGLEQNPFNQPFQAQNFQQFQAKEEQPSTFNYDPAPLPAFQQRSSNAPSESSIHPRDIELILARLDTIKVSVEHLSTRVEQLERVAREKRLW